MSAEPNPRFVPGNGHAHRSYLHSFAAGVRGRACVVEIADAGHQADLNQPDAAAAAVRDFLE